MSFDTIAPSPSKLTVPVGAPAVDGVCWLMAPGTLGAVGERISAGRAPGASDGGVPVELRLVEKISESNAARFSALPFCTG